MLQSTRKSYMTRIDEDITENWPKRKEGKSTSRKSLDKSDLEYENRQMGCGYDHDEHQTTCTLQPLIGGNWNHC